jgi:putative MFS transporter
VSDQAQSVTLQKAEPFTPYQWRLFFFLSVATFFEGFDMFALSQILPSLRLEWGLSKTALGLLATVTNFGTVLAYLLVYRADRWGRRRVMTVTIIGYTLMSLLTAASPNVYVFAIVQLLARVFLIGEWATAMVYAAEEFSAQRRGVVVGMIQAMASVGSIVCAGVVPILLKTSLGWRTVYLVGAIPLLVIAMARRTLRESSRFEASAQKSARDLMIIWRTPHKKRVIQLALIWSLTYVCTQNTVTFWKEFALSERHWTEKQVGGVLTIAALVSLPAILGIGKLLDAWGRRVGAVVVYSALVLGTLGAFLLASRVGLIVALVLTVFAQSSVLALLNAVTGELFPTDVRGDGFAWSNNLLGRIGYVLSPIALGGLAEKVGWGPAIASTALFAMGGFVLFWLWIPETKGRELEETAKLS